MRPPGSGRLFLLLSALAAIVVIGWAAGGFAAIPLQLAKRDLTARDFDSAARWLIWAERLGRVRGEVELTWAKLERKRGALPHMQEHLKQAAALGVDAELLEREEMLAAAQSGQLHLVEEEIKRWLVNPGPDGAEICEAYANGLAMHGRLPEAQAVLNAWQADNPSDPEPHFRRGRIAEHQRLEDVAEQEYRQALRKNPRYAPALYALGRMLLDRKQPEDALPLYEACAAHEPATAVAAKVGVASCLRSLGRIGEARQILRGIVELGEEERLDAFHRVRALPEGDPAAFELGRLESIDGNYEAAEKWLRKTLQKNPRDLEARYALAVALRGLNRREEAEQEFEYVTEARRILAESDKLHDILSEKPDDVEARFQIGQAYLKYRSERAGVYWLQSVLGYDPDHRPTHLALADYYDSHRQESETYAQLAEYHRSMAERPEQAPKETDNS